MKFLYLFLLFLVFQSSMAKETTDSLIEEEDELNVASPEKLKFVKPKIPDNYFSLYFTDAGNLDEIMILSEAKKNDVEDNISKYDGTWSVEVPKTSTIEGDYAIVLKSKARHAAVSSKLTRPFDFSSDQLVVQYEVKFQNGQDCGGAYIKLLSKTEDLDLKQFHDKTLYSIMFGPDKCGTDSKIHFIFQHKHPKTGKFEEKHAKKSNSDLDRYFTDKKTHLYTLVLNSDNTYEIFVDQSLVNSGNLLKDFEPSVNPPKEVDDPNDKKPEDWDDRAKIEDLSAVKPEDWDESAPEYIEDEKAVKPKGWLEDEPLTVSDENAVKPKDWDDEMDGEWEPTRIDNPLCKEAQGCGPWKVPKIKNPNYRGKWSAPLIDNPNYKGVWKVRQIPNPDYFEDPNPYRMTPIGALGLELWSMSDEIVFDNFLIVDNKKAADDFASQTWVIKRDLERQSDPYSQSVVDAIREATTERPWLWIVIVLVLVLPVVLIFVYCCRRSGPNKKDVQRLASDIHKKDDDLYEPTDNDENPEAGDECAHFEESLNSLTSSVDAINGEKVLQKDETTTKADLESDSEDDSLTKAKVESSPGHSSNNSPSNEQKTKKRRARKE